MGNDVGGQSGNFYSDDNVFQGQSVKKPIILRIENINMKENKRILLQYNG